MNRTRRTLACALLILTAACARGDDGLLSTADPLETTVTDAPGRATPAPGRSFGGPARTRVPGGGPPAAGGTAAPVRVGDGGSVGANAAAFLRRDVPELVVEVDAVAGKGPRPETLDLLRRRLAAVVDKPGGVRFLPIGTVQPDGDTWTVDELRASEEASRSSHNSPSTASLYLQFVDGEPPREGAIGVAYSGSSAAIFSDQIDEAATLLVSAASIEHACTVHEVGHLLSLVNLGYESSRAHEDPEHKGHSDNPGSVMYWAVDNVGVATLLGGRTEPPTEFDADDLADLAAIRSGRSP